MTLDDYLAAEAAQSESYFRQALAREDMARLARMRALRDSAASIDELADQAVFIGWTPGDLRSKELAVPLRPVIEALWAERMGASAEPALFAAWQAFNTERMRLLIHCL